jgi:hypothetical protein
MADYDDWDEEDDCDHMDAEIDILTGIMSCRCGYTKWLTAEELRREAELQAELMEAYYRECEQTEQDAKAATDHGLAEGGA